MSKALESENTKLESVQFGHRVQSPVAEKGFLQIKNSDGSNSDGSKVTDRIVTNQIVTDRIVTDQK